MSLYFNSSNDPKQKRKNRPTFVNTITLFRLNYISLMITFVLCIIATVGLFIYMIVLIATFKSAVFLTMLLGIAILILLAIGVKKLANLNADASGELLSDQSKFSKEFDLLENDIEELKKEVEQLKNK